MFENGPDITLSATQMTKPKQVGTYTDLASISVCMYVASRYCYRVLYQFALVELMKHRADNVVLGGRGGESEWSYSC